MPPYEVMGQASARTGGARPAPASPVPPQARPSVPSSRVPTPPEPVVVSKAPSDTRPEATGWIARAQHPVLLRVPPGLLVAIGVAVVGLLVIAYLVGFTRGQTNKTASESDEVLNAQAQQRGMAGTRSGTGTPPGLTPPGMGSTNTKPPALGTPGTPGSTAGSGNATGGVKPIAGSGSGGATAGGANGGNQGAGQQPGGGTISPLRKPGLNYMVLAQYPRDEAEKLAAFMQRSEVATIIVPSNNARLFQVVALRGFTRDELTSQSRRDFERELLRLGRKWQQEEKGAGNLSDMYMTRYDGEAAGTKRKTP